MLRFLLLLLTAYIIWRLVKAVMAVLMQPRMEKTSPKVHSSAPTTTPKPYMDIQDAEFEELKSDKETGEGNG